LGEDWDYVVGGGGGTASSVEDHKEGGLTIPSTGGEGLLRRNERHWERVLCIRVPSMTGFRRATIFEKAMQNVSLSIAHSTFSGGGGREKK